MRNFLLIGLFFLPLMPIAQQQPAGDAERMLQVLKQSGYVRQEGNRVIFKVQRASDTAKVKMMYGALFNNPSYVIAFDVDGKYFERNKPTGVITDVKKNPVVQKECISDLSRTTVEQMQQNKTLSFSGKIMNVRYKQPVDTVQFRKLYPCKVRYKMNVYDVVFTGTGGNQSDSILVASNQSVAITHSVRQFEYLKNPDFEMGATIPHWKKTGEAFKDSHEGSNQLTWKEMNVVKLGGDYWKDLDFVRGYHKRYWVTSLKGMMGGNWELRRRNSSRFTGTLVSEPFKIYHFQKYLSFLVGGGKDEQNLKVELLRMQVRPRISGDIGIQQTQLPGTQSRSVRTSMDTLYVAVPGFEALTGHNNEQFRREWWNISRIDTSAYYVISIIDNSTANNGWGFINVDDFRFLDKLPTAYAGEDSLRIHRIEVDDFVSNSKQLVYVDYYTALFGAADTHTHLMSHLSMGGKLMYGAPDVGSLMPVGTIHTDHGDPLAKDCNMTLVRATSIEQALGNCNAAHGGWGFDNTCGNYLRAMLINVAFDGSYVHRVPFESNMHGDHPHAGFPNFVHWPHFSSMSHQQMYVDWIKRAYEGGLRVLVTLAVNNELLGNMVAGEPPFDDVSAYNLQIEEIKRFVLRHNDFMELALTTADMRRIIQSGKMAILLGVEVDNLGNYNYAGNGATEAKVRAEIQRLYRNGVRYIFPIHLTDNAFGGMAVYSPLFAFSNKYARTRPMPDGSMLPPGYMLEVETARDPRINYKLKLLHEDLPPGTTAGLTLVAKPILDFIGEMHFPFLMALDCIEGKIKCIPQFKIITSLLSEPGWDFYNAVSGGHVNKYGLSPMGKFAVREMMKLGMIIDIDHMSDKAVADAFAIAEEYRYPLISGHNGLREGYSAHADHKVNENNRSRAQMDRLRNIGGVFGLGIGESDSRAFLTNYRKALSMMGNKAVTMGSDINGFVVMPSPRPGSVVKYFPSTSESAMTKYSFGPANRTWDYNRDGVAHIGLFPDYFQDLKNQGMTKSERQVFFSAADYIMNLWQLCERNKTLVR